MIEEFFITLAALDSGRWCNISPEMIMTEDNSIWLVVTVINNNRQYVAAGPCNWKEACLAYRSQKELHRSRKGRYYRAKVMLVAVFCEFQTWEDNNDKS